MCYGKSSYDLRLIPNLLSSLVVVCLLEVMAYYYGCSSSHSSDHSDYSSYLSNPVFDSDSDSGTCSGRFGFADSHTMLALLSSVPTDSP